MMDRESVRRDLKAWEANFRSANAGRVPGREDIAAAPEIGETREIYAVSGLSGTRAAKRSHRGATTKIIHLE